jgi:hypothetical protein
VAIREGRWRCPYCSRVNLGRELACAGCGATRDKDVRFFLEDEAPEVEDATLLATARAGADWLCQFCSTSNRPDASVCVQCGAEKGTSPSRPVQDAAPPLVQAALGAPPAEPPPPPQPAVSRPGSGCGFRAWGCLSLVLAVLAVVLFFALRKTIEPVEVVALEWERTIDVEAYRTVREEAWDSVPAGGRQLSSRREVHHEEREQVGSERVKTGTRDLGNGFFEDVYEDRPVYESRPVYQTRYTYEIERWVKDRTARASGRNGTPQWPDPRVRGLERAGPRKETYTAVLRGSRDFRMELPLARWSELVVGQRLTATLRGGRRVIKIE